MDYFGTALSLADKVAGFFPSYDQKKRSKLTKGLLIYNRLIKVNKMFRDHDLILDLREELEPLIKEVNAL